MKYIIEFDKVNNYVCDNMENQEVIDVTMAMRFLESPDSVKLGSASSITEEAASLLARHDEVLWLRGITILSSEAAGFLGESKRPVFLSGLKSISEDVARGLGACSQGVILDGLEEISDGVAEALVSRRGGGVDLSSVRKISDCAISVLANGKEWLSFRKLESISDSAAESLGRLRRLILDGLSEISDASAESLGHVSDSLSLCGLNVISDRSAYALSRGPRKLRLDGLVELSDMAASYLSLHNGELSLRGLQILSPQSAKVLLCHGFLTTKISLEEISGLPDGELEEIKKTRGNAKEVALSKFVNEIMDFKRSAIMKKLDQ